MLHTRYIRNIIMNASSGLRTRSRRRLGFASVEENPETISQMSTIKINQENCSCDSGLDSMDSRANSSPLDQSMDGSFKIKTRRFSHNRVMDTSTPTGRDTPPSHKSLLFDSPEEDEFDIAMVMSPEPQRDCENRIKDALERQDGQPDLIGDFSKEYCLPTLTGKHQDLKAISADTLAAVLNGNGPDDIESCVVVDCRYPYEYDGGHIMGARNIFTKEAVMEEFFFKSSLGPRDPNKRLILVFHCEFSSERGPKLYRFLREQDREFNKDNYPALCYPEIYILHDGYKEFYGLHSDMCEPHFYVPMLHKDYATDLRHFRVKSKSWPGERKKAVTCLRF